MDYFVILKKDRHPHSEGFKYGPVDEDGYMSLYNEGYIDDEHNLIKKTKPKKQKEDKSELKD